MPDDDALQKGQAAPLEGVLGSDIMMCLGIGFASMSLKACRRPAMTLAPGRDSWEPHHGSDPLKCLRLRLAWRQRTA